MGAKGGSGVPLDAQLFVSEFVGTFYLVFTVGLVVLQNVPLAAVPIGMILTAMIFAAPACSSRSTGHYNPAVTLGVYLTCNSKFCSNWMKGFKGSGLSSERRDRLIRERQALIYISAQLLGGIFAGGLYSYLLGASFTLKPGAGYTSGQAAIVEILFTWALVFVVLNVGTLSPNSSDEHYSDFGGLAVGFTVLSAAFAGGAVSGCSLNPAVTFGVMVSDAIMLGGISSFRHFGLYFFCPLLGAVIAALLFSKVVRGLEVGGVVGTK